MTSARRRSGKHVVRTFIFANAHQVGGTDVGTVVVVVVVMVMMMVVSCAAHLM
jgi:hypothetical protein